MMEKKSWHEVLYRLEGPQHQSEIIATVPDALPDRVGDFVRLRLPKKQGWADPQYPGMRLCVVTRVTKEVHSTGDASDQFQIVYETFVRPLEEPHLRPFDGY